MKRLLSRWFGPAPRTTRRSLRPQLRLEELESRAVPAVTASLVGSNLSVVGDGTGNTIFVDVVGSGASAQQRIRYFESGIGLVEAGRFAGFSSLRINSGAGNDRVTIDGVLDSAAPITVQGTSGLDLVTLNALPRQAAVDIRNTSGFTDLNITDPVGGGASAALTVGATNLTLTHPGFFNNYMVNYTQADLSRLTVNLGNRGNTVTVNDTPALALTTIFSGGGADVVNVLATTGPLNVAGGGGNDVVNLGNAGRVQGIQNAVSISNPGGRTAVNVNNQNDPDSRSATLDLFTSGPEFIRLADLTTVPIYSVSTQTSTFTVNGGRGHDTFHIYATAASTSTTLNGGDGGDHFAFGDTNGTMDSIQGALAINGQAGDNFVTFYDDGSDTGHTYNFSGDTMTRDGMAPVRHSGMSQLIHYTGLGDDRVEWRLVGPGPFLNWGDRAGTDTLSGPDAANLWQLINGASARLYANGDLAAFFSGVDNLEGGAGADVFQFDDGYQLPGTIDGGDGVNTLDYSAYTTNVYVNLAAGTATNVSGGISRIQNVFGSVGDDILVGDAATNRLFGGAGRDLLIGGAGADVLDGGDGDDLLIAGSTAYDLDAGALAALAQEWARADLSYEERVASLMTGVGREGYRFDPTTVFDDGESDTLTGGDGRDWFFANLFQDVLLDRLDEELVS